MKQIAPCLGKGLSSNFRWQISNNHAKFTEECVMCTEMHVLIKNVDQLDTLGFVTTSLKESL